MKKVLVALCVLSLFASASFAFVDSIYTSGTRVGIGLLDGMLGLETSLTNYNSSANPATSSFSIAGRLNFLNNKPCKAVETSFGLIVGSTANSAAGARINVDLVYSVELKLADKLALYGDITLLAIPDISNANSRIDSISANAQVYTGGKLYL